MLDQQFSRLVMQAVIKSTSVAGAEALIHTASQFIPLFIASGTPEKNYAILSSNATLLLFAAVRGAPDLKQTIIAEILAAHGFDEQRVLMIGDALIDYESAQQNGIAFLGRVRPQDANPFPTKIEIVTDLCFLTS